MPFNILESITQEERLNFSQDFSVKRPGILDTIFPDVKTQYLKAEYYRLMAGQRLPEVAFVHALDTEAEIGTRPGFEKVLTEKLFIKRKIIFLPFVYIHMSIFAPSEYPLVHTSATCVGWICGRSSW